MFLLSLYLLLFYFIYYSFFHRQQYFCIYTIQQTVSLIIIVCTHIRSFYMHIVDNISKNEKNCSWVLVRLRSVSCTHKYWENWFFHFKKNPYISFWVFFGDFMRVYISFFLLKNQSFFFSKPLLIIWFGSQSILENMTNDYFATKYWVGYWVLIIR